jgi:hypothetical protein
MADVFNLSGCPNDGEISFSFSYFFWACVEPRYTQLMFATLLRFGREGKENSTVYFSGLLQEQISIQPLLFLRPTKSLVHYSTIQLTAKQGKKGSASSHFGFEAAERRVGHKRKKKKGKINIWKSPLIPQTIGSKTIVKAWPTLSLMSS